MIHEEEIEFEMPGDELKAKIREYNLDVNNAMSISAFGNIIFEKYERLSRELSKNVDASSELHSDDVIVKVQELMGVLELDEYTQAFLTQDEKLTTKAFKKLKKLQAKIVKNTARISSKMESLRQDFNKWKIFADGNNQKLSDLKVNFTEIIESLDEYILIGNLVIANYRELEGNPRLFTYFKQRVSSLNVNKIKIEESIKVIDQSLIANLNIFTKINEVYNVILPSLETTVSILKTNHTMAQIQSSIKIITESSIGVSKRLVKSAREVTLSSINNLGYQEHELLALKDNRDDLVALEKEANTAMIERTQSITNMLLTYKEGAGEEYEIN